MELDQRLIELFKDVINPYEVIKNQYLTDSNGNTIGFIGGYRLINDMLLTTQFSRDMEVFSNNATSSAKTKKIGSESVILRKPVVEITNENVAVLKLLNALENEYFFEVKPDTANKYLNEFIKDNQITRKQIDEYISFFPTVDIDKRGLIFPC